MRIELGSKTQDGPLPQNTHAQLAHEAGDVLARNSCQIYDGQDVEEVHVPRRNSNIKSVELGKEEQQWIRR